MSQTGPGVPHRSPPGRPTPPPTGDSAAATPGRSANSRTANPAGGTSRPRTPPSPHTPGPTLTPSPGQATGPGQRPGAPAAGASTPGQPTPSPTSGTGGPAEAASSGAAAKAPGGEHLDTARKIADAGRQGGAAAAGEEAASAAGKLAARAATDTITAGLSKVPGISKIVDKVGDAAGRVLFRGTVTVVTAISGVLILLIVGGLGGLGGLLSLGTNSQGAPAPDADQCASMPDGWCDVVYDAQRTTSSHHLQVPWTLLAGLVRQATDYARTSPYDSTDRDPGRPTPAYLAAHFAASDVTGGGTLGSVDDNAGSLAWGGYQNGQIPASALCTVSLAPNLKLACAAEQALEKLDAKFATDHPGQHLGIADAYRDLAGQQAARADWCAKGNCLNAAQPGTSNHGWGLAVDFANFGGLKQYDDPKYLWMVANGPTFGFYHPVYMDADGQGPYEPWHWEYRTSGGGVTSTAAAATDTGAIVNAAVTKTSSTSCRVANPSSPIGGQGTQAAGPFLLLPAAAADLTSHGGDPQNPCDAAAYVASALADAAAEVVSDKGAPAAGDEAGAATFWAAVINKAHVMAAPTPTTGDCQQPVTNPPTPVDILIERIWTCEADQLGTLHVISAASSAPDGSVTFTQMDPTLALGALISEAKTVAWNSSKYGTTWCSEQDPTAGVFPLTAKAAASVGAQARCDAQSNIRAAAKLVLTREADDPSARASADGPYAPMLGGWAQIPAVLGKDGVAFSKTGPYTPWSATTTCTNALDAYVLAHAGSASPFTALAGATTAPADTSAYTRELGDWPADVTAGCAGGSASDWSATALTLAQAHLTDNPGVQVARKGDQGPTIAAGPIAVPSATPTPQVTAVAGAPAAPTAADPKALLGLSAWFSWHTSAQAAPAAVAGIDSLVARLSTSGHQPEPAKLSAEDMTFTATPWQQAATDWATFYGGLVKSWDTFGTRTGSLTSSLTGTAGQYASASGDASAQVAAVIAAAERYLGTPYSWAGGGPTGPTAGSTGLVGFDCSGLTEYAFAQAGYHIGGYTGDQVTQGTAVGSLADAQPGDLLFFGSPTVHHVAIYLGDNQMIHAPKPGDVVKIAAVYETPSVIRRVIVASTPSGGLSQWISSALTLLYANGLPKGSDDTAALNLIISHESSGNPQAVNKTDSNWVAGHPSFGLMQTIPSTFDRWALPGHTDKTDPVAQIVAGARYAQSRYGSLDKVPGVLAVRAGGAYVGY